MKAIVDKQKCSGCALCESTAPEVFELRDGYAFVLVDSVPDSLESAVQQAAEDCPEQAISVA